jgi:hypothetical protein
VKGGNHMKKDKALRQDETLEEKNDQEAEVITEQVESKEEVEKPKKKSKKDKEKVEKPKKIKKTKEEKLEEIRLLAEKEIQEEQEKKRLKAEKKADKKEAKRLLNEKKRKNVKNRSKYTKKNFNKFSGRSKDGFIEFIQQDYNNAILRAERLSSINRNAYQKPIIITIPDAFYNTDKVHYRLDQKPDGKVTQIYDQALITILFFGQESLFYYQANIDHRNGHIAFDVAGEFNYFSVVHMETQIKYDNPEKPKYIMLELEVGLSDGTIVPFHLRNHRMHEDYDLPEILTQTEQQILDLFKSKVRSEK